MMLHIVADPTDPHAKPNQIGRIQPDHVKFMWNDLKLFLETHPEWPVTVDSPEAILQRCAMGIWEPWVALSAKAEIDVLGLCAWDRHEVESYYYILYLAGGRLRRHFRAGLEEAERYVYLNGGAEIRLVGRHGWGRALRRFGYESPKVYLSKNVRKTRGH